jgi:hypothetical protein
MRAVYKALAAIAIVPIGWTSTAAAQPNEEQKAFVENRLSRLNLSTAKTVGLTAFAIHFVERCDSITEHELSIAVAIVEAATRTVYAAALERFKVMRDSLDETAACRVGREMLRQHGLLKLP